jgi:hypothetical protein
MTMKRKTNWSLLASALILPLTACSSTESRVDSAMAELEQQEPVFALLRQHEPSAYGEMRALVERTAGEGGQPDQAQLIRRGREIFTRVIGRRVATAPDDVVQQMTVFIADQTQTLEKNPAVCRDLLAGTVGDIRPFIPADLQQRERALYETLLKSPSGEDRPVATQQQLQTVFGGMLDDAEGALGLTEAAVTAGLNGAGPPLDVCRTNGYMMRRISQLPATEAAPIFRLINRLAAQARQPQSPLGAPK